MIYADIYPSFIIKNVVDPIWIYLSQFFILKIIYIDIYWIFFWT